MADGSENRAAVRQDPCDPRCRAVRPGRAGYIGPSPTTVIVVWIPHVYDPALPMLKGLEVGAASEGLAESRHARPEREIGGSAAFGPVLVRGPRSVAVRAPHAPCRARPRGGGPDCDWRSGSAISACSSERGGTLTPLLRTTTIRAMVGALDGWNSLRRGGRETRLHVPASPKSCDRRDQVRL